jgi:hypothetical protein
VILPPHAPSGWMYAAQPSPVCLLLRVLLIGVGRDGCHFLRVLEDDWQCLRGRISPALFEGPEDFGLPLPHWPARIERGDLGYRVGENPGGGGFGFQMNHRMQGRAGRDSAEGKGVNWDANVKIFAQKFPRDRSRGQIRAFPWPPWTAIELSSPKCDFSILKTCF